jgi:hypothetical protein
MNHKQCRDEVSSEVLLGQVQSRQTNLQQLGRFIIMVLVVDMKVVY